jgi:predicted transcriptional regulator
MDIKRLPDTEFDIMKVFWDNDPPVTTAVLMESLGRRRQWKLASLVSFLKRLEEKGFIRSRKESKERNYFPVVSREEYQSFEAEVCLRQYHDNSPVKLFQSLYNGKQLSQEDLDQLISFAMEHREED